MKPRTPDVQLTRFPIALFRRLRFRGRLSCPRCGDPRIVRWGRFGWRQRYRCRACRRTFSDFTGTPLAYLKRIDRWPSYCRLFDRALSVRACAALLGIHKDTAFRWRRRLLASLRRTETSVLGGRVSVGRTWFPYSEKGVRGLTRPPRRVAFQGFSSETTPVWVVVACDERGASIGATVGSVAPSLGHLDAVLGGRVAPGAVLRSRTGRYGAEAIFAARRGLAWEREPLTPWQPEERPESALGLGLRFRRWLRRFRGVATRYLDEYLVWFRLVDLATGRTRPPRPTAAVLTGAFP